MQNCISETAKSFHGCFSVFVCFISIVRAALDGDHVDGTTQLVLLTTTPFDIIIYLFHTIQYTNS